MEGSELDRLIERVVDGDAAAWHELWTAIEPVVSAVTRRRQITGPLGKNEDDRRNIVLAVMERLRAQEFRRLRAYLGTLPRAGGSSFETWLATVAARVAIDYVRAHPECRDPRGRHPEMERWVRMVPVTDADPVPPGLDPTGLATASQMIEHARAELRKEQLAALFLWLQGSDKNAIAARLELASVEEAQRLVRSALKRLRDRYARPALADAGAEGEVT